MCPIYNEPYVGYIEESRRFVCNTEIREKKLMNVKFTALVCKKLNGEFSATFDEFRKSKDTVTQIDPDVVKQKASVIVKRFFSTLSNEVKNL